MKEAKKEALRWFLQSEDDFRFVEWVKEESVFYDKGCFIAQQSGEKALKACLYARGERYVLGHSLFEMVGRLCQTEVEFKTISDEAKRHIGKTLLRYEKDPYKHAERLTDSKLGNYRFTIGDYSVLSPFPLQRQFGA